MKYLLPLVILLAGCGGSGPASVKLGPSDLPSGPIFGTLIIGGRTATARAAVTGAGVVISGPGPDISLPLSDVTQRSPLRVAWKQGMVDAEFVQ